MQRVKDLLFVGALGGADEDEGAEANSSGLTAFVVDASNHHHGSNIANKNDEEEEDEDEDEEIDDDENANNNPPDRRRTLRFNIVREERGYDPNAPVADGVHDHSITAVNARRAVIEYSTEQLDQIKSTRILCPGRGSVLFADGSRCKVLQYYHVSSHETHPFLPNIHELRYLTVPDFDPESNPGRVAYAPEDDHIVNKAMVWVLRRRRSKSILTLSQFYSKYIQGNWAQYFGRNFEYINGILAQFQSAHHEADEEDDDDSDDDDDDHFEDDPERPMAQAVQYGFNRVGCSIDGLREEFNVFSHQLSSQRDESSRQMDAQRDENGRQMDAQRVENARQMDAQRQDSARQLEAQRQDSARQLDALHQQMSAQRNHEEKQSALQRQDSQAWRDHAASTTEKMLEMIVKGGRSRSLPRKRLPSEEYSVASSPSSDGTGSPSSVSTRSSSAPRGRRDTSSQGSPVVTTKTTVPRTEGKGRMAQRRRMETPSGKKTKARSAATEPPKNRKKGPNKKVAREKQEQKKPAAKTKPSASTATRPPPAHIPEVLVPPAAATMPPMALYIPDENDVVFYGSDYEQRYRVRIVNHGRRTANLYYEGGSRHGERKSGPGVAWKNLEPATEE